MEASAESSKLSAMTRNRICFALAWVVMGCAGCTGLTREQQDLLWKGEDAYRRKQYMTAIVHLDKFLGQVEGKPEVGKASYLRGLCHARTQQRAQAYADLRRAVGIEGDSEILWRAYVTLGSLQFDDGDWSGAVESLSAGRSRMPSAPPRDVVLYRIGLCQERLGRWDESRTTFAELVSAFPSSPQAAGARRRLELSPRYFSIQCGVFREQKNAEGQQLQLRRQNLPAVVRSEQRDGKSVFVVLSGEYASYEEAKRRLPEVQKAAPDAVLWP